MLVPVVVARAMWLPVVVVRMRRDRARPLAFDVIVFVWVFVIVSILVAVNVVAGVIARIFVSLVV